MIFDLVSKILNSYISTQLRNKINMNLFYYSIVSRILYCSIPTQLINKIVNNKII